MAKVNVRRHKRKGRKVKKHTRNIRGKKARISKSKRKIFTAFTKYPQEVGGQMDFEYGDLENFKVHFGSDSDLEFDWNPDYELSYHTHPGRNDTSILPSFDDIISMRETNEKEQIIFRGNIALSIAEKSKFRFVPLNRIRRIDDMMHRDFRKGLSDRKIYLKYRPIFKRELGLSMNWHKPGTDIQLESESI